MFSQRNVYDMSNFVTFVYYVYVNYVMLKIYVMPTRIAEVLVLFLRLLCLITGLNI